MAEVLKKFGRYFLMDHIAQGGMAEIFRARLASAEGGGRLIVIKRIQQGYGSNNEFRQMFKSEIKVTMGFNHPNICQLYDFGEESGQPYIAMEFLDGRNVRQFLTKAQEQRRSLPVDLAVYLIEQSAAGLAYAHSFKDKISGKALNIVHRDISPQNIIVTYDGAVKIIDFGIAKAANNVESTRAGVIKGKPSYLAPEQISGEVLDGRCDVFALGIVLWEVLVGKKLFAAESDLGVLKLIENATSHVKPPSQFNPEVPRELDLIVLKALAKSRDKRFHTADEFQRTLRKFLLTTNPEFDVSQVASYARDLFRAEIQEDHRRLQDLSERAEQLLAQAAQTTMLEGIPSIPSDSPPADPTAFVKKTPTKSIPKGIDDAKLSAADFEASKQISVDPEDLKRVASAAAPATARQRMESSLSSSGLRKSTRPSLGRPDLTGSSVRSYEQKSSWPGLVIALAIVGCGIFFGKDVLEKFGIGRAPASSEPALAIPVDEPRLEDSGPVARPLQRAIQLKLDVSPGGADAITLNRMTVDPASPIVTVNTDAPLDLVVEKKGYITLRKEFVIESREVGTASEKTLEIALDPSNFGYLTVYSTPSADATLSIEGKSWTKKTPFEREKLPPGTYELRLRNELLGMEKTVQVSVKDGEVTSLTDIRLELK